MTIQEKVEALSTKEFAALAIIIGFEPRYYKKCFEYEFKEEKLKDEFKISYDEFKEIKKNLDKMGLTKRVLPLRMDVRKAWCSTVKNEKALPSQTHMWAWKN